MKHKMVLGLLIAGAVSLALVLWWNVRPYQYRQGDSFERLRGVFPEPLYVWKKLPKDQGIIQFQPPTQQDIDEWAKWERWHVTSRFDGRLIDLHFCNGVLV